MAMSAITEPERCKARVRVALLVPINCWLVYHLAAIVIAPASVPPSSLLEQSTWLGVQPYVQTLFLNHGYHYFAPEPGPSTLLAYVARREDGTEVNGRIPNFDIKPRLLYHRHFMLTEFYGFVPSELEEAWTKSYARHICRKYHAAEVSLSRLRHYIPSMPEVVEGATLDDPERYEEQPLGTFRCDEF
jgi:hypothetical protein